MMYASSIQLHTDSRLGQWPDHSGGLQQVRAWRLAYRAHDDGSRVGHPHFRRAGGPRGTQPFCADDDAWQADLPLRNVQAFDAALPKTHRLVLISGANFHEEMGSLSQALSDIGHKHVFVDRRDMKHHWNSGWIEEGLKRFLETK